MKRNGILQEQVFEFVKTIPAGKVVTYGQIAEHFGNKNLARMIGNVLHKNPDPVNVPCHRIVNRKGEVADNYAFGGAKMQRIKLEEEGIVFEENGCVDLRKYGLEFL